MAPTHGCAASSFFFRSFSTLVTAAFVHLFAACGETPTDTNGDSVHTDDPPRLSITPTTLSFNAQQGGSTTPQVVNVANSGDGSLSYTCQCATSWITLSNASGTAPGQVTVDVDIQGLDVGTHTASLTITSAAADNSPQTVPVSLALSPPPSPWLHYSVPRYLGDPIDHGSISSDGQRLVAMHKGHDGLLDTGTIWEWTGDSWTMLTRPSLECFHPDVAVSGDFIAATWYDDGHDYHFYSNVLGYWTGESNMWYRDQYGMSVAFGAGRPYVVFSAAYVAGVPTDFTKLHLESPDPPGLRLALAGSSGRDGDDVSIGHDPAIAGDENAIYLAYTQGSHLYVDKGTMADGIQPLGPNIAVGTDPQDPEIVLFEGEPVVAWFENGATELHVKRWRSYRWVGMGDADFSSGARHVYLAANDTTLYVTYTTEMVHVQVDMYDGFYWTALPSPSDPPPLDDSYVISADISVFEGRPWVAYTRDGSMTVSAYVGSPSGNPDATSGVHRIHP